MHVGQFAVANPGLIFLEGTSVSPEGRISKGDLCLYTDAQEKGLKRLVDFVKSHSASKLGIQLFHAGRKGSQYRPWDKGTQYGDGDTIPIADGGWHTLGPSKIAYSDKFPVPREMTKDDLVALKLQFVESAIRADRAGIDTLELHYAHGYLLHTFLSPASNQRTDEYGGPLENRLRFPLEVFSAVNEVWPAHKPLGARISGSDYGTDPNGWGLNQAIIFSQKLRDAGADYLDVSGGFLSPDQDIFSVYGPAFQTELAARIRQTTGLPTISVGAITNAHQAENIVETGKADAVALARGMLYNPRWPWHAAHQLKAEPQFPAQYERAFSLGFPDLVFDVDQDPN